MKKWYLKMLCVCFALFFLIGCSPANVNGNEDADTGGEDDEGAILVEVPPALTNPEGPPEGAEFAEELTFYAMACSVIDPGNAAFYTPQASWYTNNVYNTLVKVTIENEYIPALATEWSTEDYKTFNFKLREGVTFHNGEPFTADDVVFTIERGLDSPGARAFDIWSALESWEVVSDYEINLVTKEINIDFIDDMTQPGSSILNREALAADPEYGSWIGTGPWKVEELVVNQYTTFVRNDDYWGELPVTKKLTYRTIPEQSAQLIALENGELDSVQGLHPQYLPELETNDKYTCTPFVVNNTAYVGFNMLDPLMADINFRMAVAYALNRDDCVVATRSGYAVPLESGTFWGYATEFKNTDIPLIPRDLEKAKEYLAKTDYAGEEIEIVCATNDHIRNAQVVQANLNEIGINVKLYETDAAGLAAYTPVGGTDYQMICYSAAFTNLASSCSSLYYPGMLGNKANYDNPQVTELLDKAAATLDATEREAIYKEIQEITAADMPYIGIFNMVYEIVSQKGVGGLGISPALSHDWSYAYKVIE